MTEKDYNPEQRNAKAMTRPAKASKKDVAPVKKVEDKIENVGDKVEVIETTPEKTESVEKKTDALKGGASEAPKKEEKKVTKPKVKRTEAVVNSYSVPISTKHSVAVSKFIKYKKIETAMEDLQQVVIKKKAVPMKGEIPHRKGKIMSGRFPKKAAEHFIKILKTLKANATVNELENPVISEVIANMAQRPRGSGGRVKHKRTHVKIVAREKVKKAVKKVEAKKE